MVTSDGIIVTDPINADAAKWLKAELATRFNQPVKFLVYSHDHADHISGGEIYADTAMVVSQSNAKGHIVGENRPTAAPDITFENRLDITLGGKAVELHYLGRGHGDNMIVMRFPSERILFVVDVVSPGTVGFRDFPGAISKTGSNISSKSSKWTLTSSRPVTGEWAPKQMSLRFAVTCKSFAQRCSVTCETVRAWRKLHSS